MGRRGPNKVLKGMLLLERRKYAEGERFTLWAVAATRRSRGGGVKATLVTYEPHNTRQRVVTFEDGEISGAFRPFSFTQDDYVSMWGTVA